MVKEKITTEEVVKFATSMRGRYIISQALYYGIEELKKVKSPHTEFSNIADMELLREKLYFFFIDDETIEKAKKKLGGKTYGT